MKKILVLILTLAMACGMMACSASSVTETTTSAQAPAGTSGESTSVEQTGSNASNPITADPFALELDNYSPKKNAYKIYFNYKNIHVWYDPIELGIQAAIKKYAEKGIKIEYEWVAPADPDAADQVNRIDEAVGRGFDVICVEPSNLDLVAPAITNIVKSGVKVLCYGASDLTGYEESSGRSAFIGCSDPYADGVALTEEFCKEIGYKGQVCNLGGTIGAPGHEAINKAFNDVIAKYPDIKLLDTQYDNDELEKAIQYTENFLQKYPDLAGIFCNNMTNPIGAAQAVTAAGKAGQIVICGFDHDIQALEYLEKKTVGCLAIVDCYGMGFNTLMTAIKVADGGVAGKDFEGIQPYPVTLVYPDQAKDYISALYPNQ